MTISAYFWLIFALGIAALLAFDLKVVHKRAHAISVREAAVGSAFWVILALVFNAGIYFFMGKEKALQFLTGYLIEESLSVDNLFVFFVIFNYFRVPLIYQPRVLHWGIIGAIGMRFILIFAGIALFRTFHWIIYLFGFLLILTGLKTAFGKEKKLEPEKSLILKIFKKMMPVAIRDFVDEQFFVRREGVRVATPLFIVLLLIESSDLIFAMDSIPAVLAVSTDTFIVYTSNIFAILGLRSLYYLLSSLIPLFTHLKFGIAVVLCCVGVKMMVGEIYQIPTVVSLCVVAGILGCSILLSLVLKKEACPVESVGSGANP